MTQPVFAVGDIHGQAGELDRVLGGGLVPGSVILIGGALHGAAVARAMPAREVAHAGE